MEEGMTTIEQVKEFHKVFNRTTSDTFNISDRPLNELRLRLMREEVDELEHALELQDLAEVLDALTDIQYILDGTYLSLGMHHLKESAFEEVHKSNMTKLGVDGKPIIREDGKIIKGPNYRPPNMRKFIV